MQRDAVLRIGGHVRDHRPQAAHRHGQPGLPADLTNHGVLRVLGVRDNTTRQPPVPRTCPPDNQNPPRIFQNPKNLNPPHEFHPGHPAHPPSTPSIMKLSPPLRRVPDNNFMIDAAKGSAREKLGG
ncbi:hypothetical protein GCM10027614_59060 [Micromonospora vulcania]